MSSSPKVVVLVRPSRCRWVCSDSCYCPVSWWYLATDFIRLNASAALSVVITTGCRAGQSETRERVVKKWKARSTQCRHAKPYYPGAPLLGWPGLTRARKKERLGDGHMGGGHASVCCACRYCAALQPCDGRSQCGRRTPVSGAWAIMPAARALLVVAAPQK